MQVESIQATIDLAVRPVSDAADDQRAASNGHDNQDSADKRRQLIAALGGAASQNGQNPEQVDVKFQLADDIDRVIARIVDSRTGEVVREVPPDELVDLARRMTALLGSMLDERA